MKRDRRAEGVRILQDAEDTLRKMLCEALPEVITSGEALFTNSRFNPHNLPSHLLSKLGEALLGTSTACVEMRAALGLPTRESVGQLFLDACAEAASSDEQRRGPRRLAAALLERLTHVD